MNCRVRSPSLILFVINTLIMIEVVPVYEGQPNSQSNNISLNTGKFNANLLLSGFSTLVEVLEAADHIPLYTTMYSPKKWLYVFRAVAISQGWKKRMYLSKVPNHLRGLANKWYYDQYFQSMEEFEAEFIARFTNDLTPQQAMKKMLSLKQGSDETVEEYTERFLTIRMK